jgi:hypothetical protein
VRPRRRPFRTAFAATVTVLALLCALFAVLGYVQGPKLSSAQIDGGQAVLRSGEQLRLFANQPLAQLSEDDVTVTPAVDFTVSVSGAIIAVQFGAPLHYDADYEVTVSGVTSRYNDQAATLRYSFSTGSSPVYYLDRGETADEIVRTTVSTNERDVIYSAPGIQNFAVLAGAVAVTTDQPDGTSALSLVSLEDGGVEPLALPTEGTVAQLHASDTSAVLGFEFTSAPGSGGAYDSTLMSLNLDRGRDVLPVAGLDGAPVRVADWAFAPGGVSLVAFTTDHDLLLIDSEAGVVTPLGSFAKFDSLSTDGTRVAVGNDFGPVVLSIDDLSDTEFAPSPIGTASPYPGPFQLMRGSDLVQQVVLVNYETSKFASVLVTDDGEESRVLYRTVDDRGSIGEFSVSPNDQLVAVEIVPDVATSESDGRLVDERSADVTTVFIDIATGAIVKSVAGFAVQW